MCQEGAARTDADVVATATASDSGFDSGCLSEICVGASGTECSAGAAYRVCGGGRWGEECDADGDAAEGLEPLGVKVRLMEELGVPAQAKEGVAFASAGLADVVWEAGECSGGYWERCGQWCWGRLRTDEFVCLSGRRLVRFARMPTLAAIKPSRRWGTRYCWLGPIDDALFGTSRLSLSSGRPAGSVVMIIESSPNNLDLRHGYGCAK